MVSGWGRNRTYNYAPISGVSACLHHPTESELVELHTLRTGYEPVMRTASTPNGQ